MSWQRRRPASAPVPSPAQLRRPRRTSRRPCPTGGPLTSCSTRLLARLGALERLPLAAPAPAALASLQAPSRTHPRAPPPRPCHRLQALNLAVAFLRQDPALSLRAGSTQGAGGGAASPHLRLKGARRRPSVPGCSAGGRGAAALPRLPGPARGPVPRQALSRRPPRPRPAPRSEDLRGDARHGGVPPGGAAAEGRGACGAAARRRAGHGALRRRQQRQPAGGSGGGGWAGRRGRGGARGRR